MRLVTIGAAIAAMGLAAPCAALAGVTIVDTYYGGTNYYNNNAPISGDVIGTSDFDIQSAEFTRTDGGATLRVTINTNYAGVPGTPAAETTGYGALFITPGLDVWTPQGADAPYYASDTYQAGDWTYAFAMEQNPSTTSGTASLYKTSNGNIVMSNVLGNPVSYPNPGNPGYYFRQDQAVQFTATGPAEATGGWTVDAANHKLVFDIHDGGALGNNFAFSYAMSCANDIIQGQVNGVPEPATWALMILGFGAVGATARRRRVAA